MARGKKQPVVAALHDSDEAEAVAIPVRVIAKAATLTEEAASIPVALDPPAVTIEPSAASSVEEGQLTTSAEVPVVPEPEHLQILHIPGETEAVEAARYDKPVISAETDEDDLDEWDDDFEDDEPSLPRGKRAVRALRHALVGAFALLAILIGLGLGYTYFMGGTGNGTGVTTVAATVAPDPTAGMVKPRAPSPKAPESAAIQMVSSPVKRGGPASLSVKTQPTSVCTVIVDHEHVAYAVPTLKKQTADDFGTVNWDWIVPKTAPVGSSTVTVTCKYLSRSAVVQGDVLVKP
jgi:hypothetical protein